MSAIIRAWMRGSFFGMTLRELPSASAFGREEWASERQSNVGLRNREIATQLNLSEQTVKNHIHRMIQRVGADGRLEAVEMVRTRVAYV